MRYPVLVFELLIAMAVVHSASARDLLHLHFNDSSQLGLQSGILPLGEPSGDVKPSSALPGSAEFGPAGGFIRVPDFQSPTGPFTVEARFRIRNFGPESSNFIANILNTVPDYHQGFAFRVGGGYLYPPLPRNAYKTESEWLHAQEGYSNVDRERLSDCFAVFVMAGKGGSWKEAYTDRCIEKDTWTHLVGIWDGAEMRIYLNGVDATDLWRIQGSSAEPFLGSKVEAHVGSRTSSTFDPRHLDGTLDYVRVEDGALSENEIHERYSDTFVPQARDSLCMGVVIPEYPEAGQLFKGKLDFGFKITNHGACTDPAFLAAFMAGDSVEIEISKNASFTDLVLRSVVAFTTLHLEAEDLSGLAGYKGTLYWRVRLIHGKQAGLAKSAEAPSGEWSLSRPVVLDMSDVSPTGLGRPSLKPVLVQARTGLFVPGNGASSPPVLFNLTGKRQPARFQRVAGGWKLNPADHGLSGLFLIVK